MSKKWYNLFVSVNESGQPEPAPEAPVNAADAVASIAAAVAAEPKFTTPVNNPAAFQEIYAAAEIAPPPHGFSIMKVAEMLRSEHIRNLPRDVKRSSVLVALEAAGASLQDVVEDAVKRDRALDTFERVQLASVEELENRKRQEDQQIQAEMDRIVTEHRARMEANQREVAREKERFFAWRLKKQEEEQKIADAVSYFVTENPITTGSPAAAPAPAQEPPK
jgi:hypothetical protein